MSYRLNPDETVRHGLKRIVSRQLRRAQRSLQQSNDEKVHEARKSVKKVRAIVRLLRQMDTAAIGKDARRLRAASRVLSNLRDAEAMFATLDRVRQHFPKRLPEHTAALIRRELIRIKAQITEQSRNGRRVARAARTLRSVRRSVERWDVPKLEPLDLADFLKAGYRASRKAMREARKTTSASDLHRWRKRVKTIWYQMRLVQGRAPALRTMLERLERLETVLGEHHDLVVLQSMVEGDDRRHRPAEALRHLTALTERLQTTLRRKALTQGRRILAARPKSFARALKRMLSASSRKSASTARESPSAAA